jgi:hypothetical protein
MLVFECFGMEHEGHPSKMAVVVVVVVVVVVLLFLEVI